MKRKPIIGEILYDLNIGNAAGRRRAQILTPVEVKSVGRKYFTCTPIEGRYHPETTYKIEDWQQKTEYCKDHKLYETTQEWDNEKEVGQIHAALRKEFNHYGQCRLPLETLRAIKSLVADKNPKQEQQ